MRYWGYVVGFVLAALIFAGIFSAVAAATGSSFDDAEQIGEGTHSGTVENEYYYKVSVPAYKAILVTLTSGSDSFVSLQIYDGNRQSVGLFGYASSENGETDRAFYDGKSTTEYTVYIKMENIRIFNVSSYTIKVEFRPGDIKDGATALTDGQSTSGTLKYSMEVHWYKIEVPKGKLLNVTFSSRNGEIMVTLYRSDGSMIDGSTGTSGWVDTKLLGETGTVYIEVKPYEYQNRDISYTLTPKLSTGSSVAEEAGTAIATTCLVGIAVAIIVVVLLIVLVVKVLKGKK